MKGVNSFLGNKKIHSKHFEYVNSLDNKPLNELHLDCYRRDKTLKKRLFFESILKIVNRIYQMHTNNNVLTSKICS